MSRIPPVSRSTRIWKIRISGSARPWKTVKSLIESNLSIAYCVKDKLNNDLNCGIFAVFDGHGGKHVADHVAERMPEEIRKEIMKNPGGDLGPAIE